MEDSGLSLKGSTILTDTLLQIFKYSRLNKIYSESKDQSPLVAINLLLDQLELNIDLPDDDLPNIPEKGPFIAVSNHPFRGIDSMLLFKLIYSRRDDFKIMASHLLKDILPLSKIIIPVNTYESSGEEESSYRGIREGLAHLRDGHCIGIFPTAEDSKHWDAPKIILDQDWKTTVLKFVRHADVPVVPVYFHGTKSRLTHIIRKINPVIQKKELPKELLNKRKRTIKIRIGAPISVREQAEFSDITKYGRYLRARVYTLGSTLEHEKPLTRLAKPIKGRPEEIISPVPVGTLVDEFEKIRPDHELFVTKNYSILCAPVEFIPNIFREIGRLREVTFREVGEGTNKSIDIDEYDIYFHHLFIWDTEEKRLVGAYRIGKGKDILKNYGIGGFYINSLFNISREFSPILREAIELGRSFIARDYQKKAIPLFMLWKGIMVFLLRNTDYRYLIGPVSISNDLSRFSKTLIVEFIRNYFWDEELSKLIRPIKDFVPKPDRTIDRSVFIDFSERDINKIERIITDIEPGYHIPILLKKYLEINGKIIGFNIDPKFNNCLDGLLILDTFSTPREFIQGLSREMNDPSIIQRFTTV